jgi:hypothetical protein
MTEPTYHCNWCKRQGITDGYVSARRHKERKSQMSGLIAIAVASIVVAALAVGCVAGLLAVFG